MFKRAKQWLAERVVEHLGPGDLKDHLVEVLNEDYVVSGRGGSLYFYPREEVRASSQRIADRALAQFPRQTPKEFALSLDSMVSVIDTPTIQELVYSWERQAGFDAPPEPRMPSGSTRAFRVSLIQEELQELNEALAEGDLVETADALGDIIWVTYAAARAFGIDLDTVIREIDRSNRTKFIGGCTYDENGKLQKGEHYEPPKIEPLLEEM